MPGEETQIALAGRPVPPITAKMIREYGIRALVHETVTEEIQNGRVVHRVIERQRVEFGDQAQG